MLPANRRVNTEAFSMIMKKGAFFQSELIYLVLLDKKDGKPSSFSVVVPNKVKKTSVGRHLIKRRISTILEKLLFGVAKGYSGVFFVKKDISLSPLPKIKEELINLLKKAKILNM